ncbi:MAG: hypothetical protein B7Z60_09900 [Ferrovum sp. 37-45-19]|nr:MAG: hypothetical protein B7Z60_09900 [Ferrovum sp. 37-45-19]
MGSLFHAILQACHGTRAQGVGVVPRLAGQTRFYLFHQIAYFAANSRLDNAMIERLASYYSAQNPVPGSPQNPASVAEGKLLYQRGVADKVLSCMACHGTKAEGLGAIPRLAGQRRLSLVRQLGYFATNLRANALMQQEATNLTALQRSDIADYLAAQTESNPSSTTQSGSVTPQQFASTIKVCSACHEFGGRDARISPAFTFPRIAGQQKDYLVAQLKAFRDKTRADPRARAYMWDQAARLDNAMIERLASYYSAQNPVPGSPQNPASVAEGKIIYQQGIPDKIPPCMACHLPAAQGLGTTPRLAGQRRLILARRLKYFAANAPPNGIMMHKEAKHLTFQQINDISTYLASLHFSDQ